MKSIETTEALALAGVSRSVWNAALMRGHYTEAPPTTKGVPRYFDRDYMVALFVFSHFDQLGVSAALVGRIASAVRRELRNRDENLPTLWVACSKSKPTQHVVSCKPPSDLIRHEISIAELRRKIEAIPIV